MTTTAGHSFYIGPIGSFYKQVNDTGFWEPLIIYLIYLFLLCPALNIAFIIQAISTCDWYSSYILLLFNNSVNYSINILFRMPLDTSLFCFVFVDLVCNESLWRLDKYWFSDTISSFCEYVSFFINIQPRLTYLAHKLINMGVVSQACATWPWLHFMVYWLLNLSHILVIMSVFPLLHNHGLPYLLIEDKCQSDICHLTLTSFSWSTNFA
jgi:hypothetical protein